MSVAVGIACTIPEGEWFFCGLTPKSTYRLRIYVAETKLTNPDCITEHPMLKSSPEPELYLRNSVGCRHIVRFVFRLDKSQRPRE